MIKNEIVPVESGKLGLMVNSRLLWQKLKSKRQYANWIAERIERYGFVEGMDFLINLLKSTGGRRSVDYVLTLDMAKELAMVEKTDAGRAIRRYFIEIEKQYRDWIGFILPRLETDFEIFGRREGYNYMQLLLACGCSVGARAMNARVRKNEKEFWRNQNGVMFVSEIYGKTIITNAIARRLNAEAKERRLVAITDEMKALAGEAVKLLKN